MSFQVFRSRDQRLALITKIASADEVSAHTGQITTSNRISSNHERILTTLLTQHRPP